MSRGGAVLICRTGVGLALEFTKKLATTLQSMLQVESLHQ